MQEIWKLACGTYDKIFKNILFPVYWKHKAFPLPAHEVQDSFIAGEKSLIDQAEEN